MGNEDGSNGQHRIIFDALARVETRQETMGVQLAEISEQLRRLPCTTHEFRLDRLDGQALGSVPNRPAKTPSSEHTTYRDLEESQEHVLSEMRDVAEATVEQRLATLEQQRRDARDDRRKQISWTLSIVQAIAAMIFGGGAVFVARCAVESKGAQAHVNNQPAAAVRWVPPASLPTKQAR